MKSINKMCNEIDQLTKKLNNMGHNEIAHGGETLSQLKKREARLRMECRNTVVIKHYTFDGLGWRNTSIRKPKQTKTIKCIYCGSTKMHAQRCDSCGSNIDK